MLLLMYVSGGVGRSRRLPVHLNSEVYRVHNSEDHAISCPFFSDLVRSQCSVPILIPISALRAVYRLFDNPSGKATRGKLSLHRDWSRIARELHDFIFLVSICGDHLLHCPVLIS